MLHYSYSLKRRFSLFLAICFMISLIGCASTNVATFSPSSDPTTEPSTAAPSVPATKPTEPEETEPGTEPPTEPVITEPVTVPATEPSVPSETEPTEQPSSPTEPTEPATDPEAGTTPTEPAETTPTVSFVDTDETVYAITTVNVRMGPSTDYEKLGALTYGQSIRRTGIGSNGWSRVIYNGQEAYMYSDYLSTAKPAEPESYPLSYSDETCTITITREWFEDAWCYIAHLQFTDYTRFGTACANGGYDCGYETTSHAANRLGAIFTVNGCYSAPYLNGTCVRSGKLWNGAGRRLWSPGVYSSHTGLLLTAWEINGMPGVTGEIVDDLIANGTVTDTFSFGPPFLMYGEITCKSDTSRAQRTFIGTNGEPGDLWVVVSDGRYVDGESAGLTTTQCARLLQAKGCTLGVPLDGGGSSTMVFQGKVLNSARGNERAVVDFVYFK